ncbi:MAG: hypothetical protein IPM41_06790 [Sphingomonadales bacterium]|nr:hypothetical protein [Sphingomonadales bacterium]
MSFELMNRVQIDEITGGRDLAIARWLDAFDSFHRLSDEAAGLSIGGALSLSAPSGDRYNDTGLTRAFLAKTDHEAYDRETHSTIKTSARGLFRREDDGGG